MQAIEMLKQDHARVHELFDELERSAPQQRQELLDRIADELEIHAQLEEEIFYAAASEVTRRTDDLRAGHEQVRTLVERAEGLDPHGADFMSALRALKGCVLSHVAEEEGSAFLEAARLGPAALDRLGQQMAERRETLASSVQRGQRAAKRATRKVA